MRKAGAAAALLAVLCAAGPWAPRGCAGLDSRGMGFVSQGALGSGPSLRARLSSAASGGRAATCAAPLGLAMMNICELSGDYAVGDKVRLTGDAKVFHVKPKDFPDGFVIKKEWVGEVTKVLTTNPEITPNRPILVTWKQPEAPPKFVYHVDKDEIERV